MHELMYLHMHIKAHFIKIQKIAAHTKLKMAYQLLNKIKNKYNKISNENCILNIYKHIEILQKKNIN